MVSPQATEDSTTPHPRPTDWGRDDPVRITAQQRRQVLREHYTEKLAYQQAVVADERNDRKVNGDTVVMYTHADLKVSNTIAVLQDISSTLAAYSDNRDFTGQVTR